MGRLGRGWQLTKMSFGVIRQDKKLLLFPFLATLISVFMWGLFLASVFFLEIAFIQELEEQIGALIYAFFFLFYFLTAFIAVYFNAAVVGFALLRLEGGSPTFRDGFRQANKHVGKLLQWALVSATVGLILRAVRRRGGFVGRLIASVAGFTWAVASFLAVPIIVTEGLGPFASLKRSVSLFRKKWGETLVGGFGLGLILILLALAGVLIIVLGVVLEVYLEVPNAILVGLLAAVIYWFFIFLLWGAAWPVLSAVLYRYATTGETAPGVREMTLQDIIRT
jgi:hypothetical protein